jgi:ketosteroid isomerase-like protein
MSHPETIRHLLKLSENSNVPEVVKLFDKEATYQFANLPPVAGLNKVGEAVASGHMGLIKRVDVKDIIELGNGVLVCEMEITFGTKDGRQIVLPCSDLFRFADSGLIRDMKVFMDATPLNSPAAT